MSGTEATPTAYDKDATFDLEWSVKRYPTYRVDELGVWRPVLDEAGDAVAVVYTNESSSVGILWIYQTDMVWELAKHFVQCAEAGISAYDAYRAASVLPGTEFGPETSGKMQGVNDLLQQIWDTDEA